MGSCKDCGRQGVVPTSEAWAERPDKRVPQSELHFVGKPTKGIFSFVSDGEFKLDFYTECELEVNTERVQVSFEEQLTFVPIRTTISFNPNGIFFERLLLLKEADLEELADVADEFDLDATPVQAAFLAVGDPDFGNVELEIGFMKLILSSEDMKMTISSEGVTGEIRTFAVKGDRRTPDFMLKYFVRRM